MRMQAHCTMLGYRDDLPVKLEKVSGGLHWEDSGPQ